MEIAFPLDSRRRLKHITFFTLGVGTIFAWKMWDTRKTNFPHGKLSLRKRIHSRVKRILALRGGRQPHSQTRSSTDWTPAALTMFEDDLMFSGCLHHIGRSTETMVWKNIAAGCTMDMESRCTWDWLKERTVTVTNSKLIYTCFPEWWNQPIVQ